MKGKTRLIFFGVVALQLIFILGLVAYKEITLRFGQEVVLQTVPVDPRDLFRGDYVVLRYDISTLGDGDITVPYWLGWKAGDRIYVRLRPTTLPDGQNIWIADRVAADLNSYWDVFIKGRITRIDGVAPQTTIQVEYGIEAFFVPEDQGPDTERADNVKVRVAVDGFGQGVIKGLIVDGQPWQPR